MKKIRSYLDYFEIEAGLWNWLIFYAILITMLCFFMMLRVFQLYIIIESKVDRRV